MPSSFRIPRLTDEDIIKALLRVIREVAEQRRFRLTVTAFAINKIVASNEDEATERKLKWIFTAKGQLCAKFQLQDEATGVDVIVVSRQDSQSFDMASLPDAWTTNIDESSRNKLVEVLPAILAKTRKYLKSGELENIQNSGSDTSFAEFRSHQTGIIQDLERSLQELLVEAGKAQIEQERLRNERFADLETQLRAQVEQERQKILDQLAQQEADLASQRDQHLQREKDFETKEARYVARKGQQDQIEQIKAWLEDWRLTKGTIRKRWPITASYIVALLMTGGLTIYATTHNYGLLKSTADLATLQWWHWVLMTSKSFFPLAAFTTFMIYFIRWSSSWAKQHSEEEFVNRTRLIDIGRAAWLLEAVRDAHENDAAIPSDLLHDLSRNLFSTTVHTDSEVHPLSVSDVLLQGLSSFRLKSPDGTEIEASRGKKK